MSLVQTSAPGIEPVTLVDAKNFLRVDADLTADDTLISLLIGAARRYAEAYTGRSFISQGWKLLLDSFPGYGLTGTEWGVTFSHPRNAVLFEKGPLISVDSIIYTAMDQSTVTVLSPGAPDYAIDLEGAVPRMTPGFGRVWPIPLPQIGAVQINYTAGYGTTAASVPEGIRHWMLMRISTLYENREEVAILGRGKVDPLPFVDGLLDPYRVPLL
jgi:uncharacterized phiE125 gp8 family phage protein